MKSFFIQNELLIIKKKIAAVITQPIKNPALADGVKPNQLQSS